ncbi:unnamed protein product [Urochloa decumbens]|uniref:NB-ARC domain-containing protein n=1 Tax=Urochloa decumbens TaxID=240449 RepID=A0ABC9D9S4_9POAL
MIYQLNILRKEMYRGYFTMDSLRIRGYEEVNAKGHDVSRSFSLSKFNVAKRLLLSTEDTHREKDMLQVLGSLNNIMVHVNESIAFFNNYPQLYRQPYSMHLYIGKCMFGRQMEMDRVIDFLLQIEHPSNKNVGVLPIVGPTYVGKSTLVAHVCNDVRVRNHFSQIVVLTGAETSDESLTTLKHKGVIMHKSNALGKNDRVLTVIEFTKAVDEVAWNSLYSSAYDSLGRSSKIIITSRSNEIIKFGTTQTLVLNFLPLEAYWYFFKILTFGSVDSNDHPKFESIAMEMARGMNGSFIDAQFHSDFLRNNLDVEYWCMYFTTFKAYIQRNISLFGENPYALSRRNKPTSFWINSTGKFLLFCQYRSCFAEDNVPAIAFHDVVSGSVECEGEFEVLAWKSHILPYKYYVVRCMIEKSQ